MFFYDAATPASCLVYNEILLLVPSCVTLTVVVLAWLSLTSVHTGPLQFPLRRASMTCNRGGMSSSSSMHPQLACLGFATTVSISGASWTVSKLATTNKTNARTAQGSERAMCDRIVQKHHHCEWRGLATTTALLRSDLGS